MSAQQQLEDLGQKLTASLEPLVGSGRTLISPPSTIEALADSTAKFVVHGRNGEPELFLLCSAAAAPDIVARGVRRARDVANALGPELARPVLLPEHEGELDGRSFAVYRLCTPMWKRGPKWWVQRAWVQPRVLDWLAQATLTTTRPIPPDELDARVYGPLDQMQHDEGHSPRFRDVARRAIEAVQRGDWSPTNAFMHDDLWVDNIMIDQRTRGGRRFGKFVVIDWAGARVQGFPMYDFLRIAMSFDLDGKAFTTALKHYRDTLGLSRRQGVYAYANAVAELGGRLDEWPRERYLAATDLCYRKLSGLS